MAGGGKWEQAEVLGRPNVQAGCFRLGLGCGASRSWREAIGADGAALVRSGCPKPRLLSSGLWAALQSGTRASLTYPAVCHLMR